MFAAGSNREARAARNHSLFRAGNERLKKFSEEWFGTVLPRGGWICECSNDTCMDHIEMASVEYDAIRRHEYRFFVAPRDEHVWPDVERVIERSAGYWIVEKTGHAPGLATHADSDSGSGPLSFHT